MDTLSTLSRATPVTRERYIDLLRALSIGVVVLGHWLLADVTMRGGEVTGRNVLGSLGGLWLLTWVLQVMPLFFFVGGFSNLRSWESTVRAGGGSATFLRSRYTRLLRPTALFAVAWLAAAHVLPMLGAPASVVEDLASTVAIPLWFMAVYLIVIALTPLTAAAHRRFGMRVPLAFLGCALAVDLASRVLGVPVIGLANFVFVWLLPHQLGYAYADGTLPRLARRIHTAVAAACLMAVAVLTVTGTYAGSMVGVPGAADSNNSPPTFSLALHTVFMVALAMALREPAARWLQRRRVWRTVVGVNTVIMTVFLWHMTALVGGALLLLALGFPQPAAGSATWWLLRPVWVLALAAVLAPLVRLFGPVEIRSLLAARPRDGAISVPLVIGGSALAVFGIVTFAHLGFGAGAAGTFVGAEVTPLAGGLALGAGIVALEQGATG